MRNIKIIADSSSDVMHLSGIDFESAPLKIITEDREFCDDCDLDVAEMVDYMHDYKGRARTSCPNINDWLSAFGDAEEVFCVTITSGLSGSYNAAQNAGKMYEEEHPGRRVYVVDSLSTGPEMRLVVEKIRALAEEDVAFDDICTEVKAYLKKTGLFFMLRSLRNLSNNGRVSPILAKVVELSGIRIVGKASDEGTLEPTDKCRNEQKALTRILEHMMEDGLEKGRVIIDHCQNEKGARLLCHLIRSTLKDVKPEIRECHGLCSFYAERGGLLIGYEKE